MSGSLYYSLGAHFTPCELCWYQRICEYPLAVALLIAALRKDRDVWHYLVAPAVIGIIIASYQTQLQAYPKQHSFCQLANPCTTRYVWVFKFVSLPFMDLTALCFVLAMALVVRRSTRSVAAEPIAAEPLPERVPQGASA
jgi:disulfide bond formation protein DsbB